MGNIMIEFGKSRILMVFFIVVFFYAIAAMVVSRELAIPHMAANENGNLAGDPQLYHSLAVKKANEIRVEGIGKFEIQPGGHGPAGIASILYLIWVNPYSMVILNAFLHALSTILMSAILMEWFSIRSSIIGSLPLAISPYMMFWFSQLNKDSFVLAGAMLFIYGLLRLLSAELRPFILRSLSLYSFLFMIVGAALIWTMRPYLNQILFPIVAIILVVAFISKVKRDINWKNYFTLFIYSFFILIALALLGKGGISNGTLESFNHFQWQSQEKNEQNREEFNGGDTSESQRINLNNQDVVNSCFSGIDLMSWEDSQYVPDFANKKLKGMMGQRCLIFTMLQTQSNSATKNSFIDTDILPIGSIDALAYLPRAALLGIFSPWPDRWGYNLDHKFSIFYTIVPLEAVLLYLGFSVLCVWVVRMMDWSVLIPVLLSCSIMTVYGMATPFLGALYRYRYPWWMLLICLGCAAILDVFNWKLKQSHVDK